MVWAFLERNGEIHWVAAGNPVVTNIPLEMAGWWVAGGWLNWVASSALLLLLLRHLIWYLD